MSSLVTHAGQVIEQQTSCTAADRRQPDTTCVVSLSGLVRQVFSCQSHHLVKTDSPPSMSEHIWAYSIAYCNLTTEPPVRKELARISRSPPLWCNSGLCRRACSKYRIASALRMQAGHHKKCVSWFVIEKVGLLVFGCPYDILVTTRVLSFGHGAIEIEVSRTSTMARMCRTKQMHCRLLPPATALQNTWPVGLRWMRRIHPWQHQQGIDIGKLWTKEEWSESIWLSTKKHRCKATNLRSRELNSRVQWFVREIFFDYHSLVQYLWALKFTLSFCAQHVVLEDCDVRDSIPKPTDARLQVPTLRQIRWACEWHSHNPGGWRGVESPLLRFWMILVMLGGVCCSGQGIDVQQNA